VARVVAIFNGILVHTKGRWSRQPFRLATWQRDEIVVPLLGTVRWDDEALCWVRRYRIAWLELARKNGKSELLAALALILLVADDEESAEVYGCAKDKDQARKVFDVAARMVELSPVLRRRLKVNRHTKRIVDERTASYYEIVAADAEGNLGHNPHGIVFDEVLTQPNGDLWDAMRTAMGTRLQPLMIAATTAGSDLGGFCAGEHAYCERVAADPTLDPTRFVYLRNLPMDADPWDEANWRHPNPGLPRFPGDPEAFLSLQALRDEANEARHNPVKENAFRQFRLNQWVSQTTRWMPMHLWDACPATVEQPPPGAYAWGGLDLSAVSDLTSLCWLFHDGGEFSPVRLLWRHWVPEAMLPRLDDFSGGMASVWVREGWLTLTDGNVVDYDAVHLAIAADCERWAVQALGIDRWNSTATTNWLQANIKRLTVEQVAQGYSGMSGPLKQTLRLAQRGLLDTGGNPLARWCYQAVEVRQDDAENIRPVKPDRGRDRHRIDAVVSGAMALAEWLAHPKAKKRARAAGF
jgi:phage terminase large subunit-like protein